jgi:hypothetical protein
MLPGTDGGIEMGHSRRSIDSGGVLRRLRDAWVGLSTDWKALLVAGAVVGLVNAGLSIPG